MRLAIVAAAAATDAAEPKLGERDAGLVRMRLGLDDLGFEVVVIDPNEDLAAQLEATIARAGTPQELLFYASCLLVVMEDDECYLCLNPDEPDVGDALADVVAVLAGRASGGTLVCLELRHDDEEADRALLTDAVEALSSCVTPAQTGVEMIAAVRPVDAHPERIPSRLTAGILEAIDGIEGIVTARQVYARAIQTVDLGSWPHAVGHRPGRRDFVVRDAEAVARVSGLPAVSEREPPTQRASRPTPFPPAADAPGELSEASELSEARSADVSEPPVDEPVSEEPVTVQRPPTDELDEVQVAQALAPSPLPAVDSGAAVEAQPADPAPLLSPRQSEWREAPPSERAQSATVSLPKRKKPKDAPASLPKVVIGGSSAPPAESRPPSSRQKRPLKNTVAEGPDAKRLEEAAQEAIAKARARRDEDTPPEGSLRAQRVTIPLPEEEVPESEPPATKSMGTMSQVAQPPDDDAVSVTVSSEEADLTPEEEDSIEEEISFEEEISIEEEISFDDEPAVTHTSAPPPPKARKRAADMTVDDHIESGDFARSLGNLDEAVAHYKKGLAKLGTNVTPERAAIYMRVGHVMRAKGNLRVAVSNFDKALGITPDDREALAILIELHAEQGNWRGVNNAEQKFLAGAEDGPEKLAMLIASGERWLTRAEDKRRAKERFTQARDEFPDEVEPLRRLVAIYDDEGAHDYALSARRTIAERTPDPRERAQAYFEVGETCLFELGKDTEAYAAFEQALDADPTMLQVLEVLATALADNQEWGELERVYGKMIEKFAARTADEATKTVLAELHHRSALLYRDHLEDPEHALDALDRELAIRPHQLSTRVMAAELAAELGEGSRALDHLRAAALLEPSRAETYRQLFALGQRFDAPEIAFMAASVLHVLGLAGDRERIVYREHRTDVPPHNQPLPAEAWALLRDERDTAVEEVMRAVAPAVLRTRIKQLTSDGKLPALPEEFRQDPATSTVSAVRSLNWAARYLGVPCPDIFVDPEVSSTFHAPFARSQSTVVGKGALSGRTLAELAFLAGRHLGYRLAEHELVAHLNTIDELTLCFLAALKLVLGQAPASGAVGDAVDAFAKLLASQQTADEREALIAAVHHFSDAGGRVSLAAWVGAVERCCNRAGLLMCGDLLVAAAVIEDEGDSPYLTVKQRIDDLCAFAVSNAYARLRAELGSSLEEEDAPLSAVQ